MRPLLEGNIKKKLQNLRVNTDRKTNKRAQKQYQKMKIGLHQTKKLLDS